MAKIQPFEKYTERYEDWFEKHKYAYLSELKAVSSLLPENRENCLEIGVGTGRFAAPLGKYYQQIKEKNPFYKEAKFISTKELVNILKKVGFKNFTFVQTIFHKPEDIKQVEPVKNGFGEGSFVVVRAEK